MSVGASNGSFAAPTTDIMMTGSIPSSRRPPVPSLSSCFVVPPPYHAILGTPLLPRKKIRWREGVLGTGRNLGGMMMGPSLYRIPTLPSCFLAETGGPLYDQSRERQSRLVSPRPSLSKRRRRCRTTNYGKWILPSPPPLAFPLSGPESEEGGRGFHHSSANKKVSGHEIYRF